MTTSYGIWTSALCRWRPKPFTSGYARALSVNTAINRSLRKGGLSESHTSKRGPSAPARITKYQSNDAPRDSRLSFQNHIEQRPSKSNYGSRDAPRNGKLSFHSDVEQRPGKGIPVTIPYTTAASEFLYGTSAVKAALETRRRRCYKLYIYSGEQREDKDEDIQIRKVALQKGVVVHRVKGSEIRLMDKMSAGRPHNGFVLEASPLPKIPVLSLGKIQQPGSEVPIDLNHQSREEEEVNGKPASIRYKALFQRFPFIVLLDGILDAGNLGAIFRSAFFLGVDAIITAGNTAPMSPVALKASAGAAEHLPLLTTRQPYDFVERCKANGWQIYAADATQDLGRHFPKLVPASTVVDPLLHQPCILILGSESEGIRRRLLEKANTRVMISGSRMGQGGVDSLNVSVAAGILFELFLRQPSLRSLKASKDQLLKMEHDRLF